MDTIGSKIPPNSKEAEMAVLGSMMLDKTAISKVIETLDFDSFYYEAHKLIYQVIISLYDNNKEVDIITVTDELLKRQILDKVGGSYYIAELNSATPSAANVEYYARIVQEKHLKRLLINTAGKILTNAYDEMTDALEEIDKAETAVFDIAEKRVVKSFQNLKELSHKTLSIITNLLDKGKPGITGVPSGLTELDEYLGGFQKSDFIVIAGRPSMGKTALGLSIARNVGLFYDKPVAFFSLEMSAIQLVIRLISAEAKINQHNIRTGKITNNEYTRIVEALGNLSQAKIFIDDSPSMTLLELRAKCRRLKMEHNIELLFIDYLQLIHPPKAESREREISIISRSLKQLAKELDIPVVALAQLNRLVETRADKRPLLSDLRESGSIEQDADVVMFVTRREHYGIEKYEDNTSTRNTGEVIIGKQRNGPVGTVRLRYIKDYAKFDNMSSPEDDYEAENLPAPREYDSF